MPAHTLTFRIEDASPQKAAALREKLAELLEEDPDVTLVNRMSSPDTQTYRVVGVNTADNQPFDERVEAKDEDDARKQAGTKTRVVALIAPLP